jgi:hypothetical protein
MKSNRILRAGIANVSAIPVTASTGRDDPRRGTYSFASRDLPIPILPASFCDISLHIGIPTFFHRIVDRLG